MAKLIPLHRVSQVVVSWLAANEDQQNLWGPWDLEGIRTFVAKWDMSRIRAFWNCFDSDLTQSLSLRQMRFDSDFTQTSGQKNGDWSLWSLVAVRLSSVLSPQSSVLSPQSSVLSPQSSVLGPRSSGCNKLYKCGRQKISKKCTFLAERLKTAVLLQNLDLRHFCHECREKHNIRVSRTKFWENLLMRTSRKLWHPGDW